MDSRTARMSMITHNVCSSRTMVGTSPETSCLGYRKRTYCRDPQHLTSTCCKDEWGVATVVCLIQSAALQQYNAHSQTSSGCSYCMVRLLVWCGCSHVPGKPARCPTKRRTHVLFSQQQAAVVRGPLVRLKAPVFKQAHLHDMFLDPVIHPVTAVTPYVGLLRDKLASLPAAAATAQWLHQQVSTCMSYDEQQQQLQSCMCTTIGVLDDRDACVRLSDDI